MMTIPLRYLYTCIIYLEIDFTTEELSWCNQGMYDYDYKLIETALIKPMFHTWW